MRTGTVVEGPSAFCDLMHDQLEYPCTYLYGSASKSLDKNHCTVAKMTNKETFDFVDSPFPSFCSPTYAFLHPAQVQNSLHRQAY